MMGCAARERLPDSDKTRTLLRQEKANRFLEALLHTFTDSAGKIDWPVWYGGCHLDAAGDPVVSLCAEPAGCAQLLSQTAGVRFCKGRVPYRILADLQERLDAYTQDAAYASVTEGICSYRIDGLRGVVCVGTEHPDPDRIRAIRRLLPHSQLLRFTAARPRVHTQGAQPGQYIIVTTPSGVVNYYSAGFRCLYPVGEGFVPGFVTAGHGQIVPGSVVTEDTRGKPVRLGTVELQRYDPRLDASLVLLDSGSGFSDQAFYSRRPLSARRYPTALAVGSRIFKEGGTTQCTEGVITAVDCREKFVNSDGSSLWIRDLLRTDLLCRSGDSGGIAYIPYENGHSIAGIAIGGQAEAPAVCLICQTKTIVREFGVIPY